MKTNQRIWVFCFVAVLAVGIGFFFWLGQGYGKVTPETYQFSKALYGACQTRSEERIAKVEQMLDSEEASQIPDRERTWLERIVQQAQNGRWESAAKQARRMMEDQVDY